MPRWNEKGDVSKQRGANKREGETCVIVQGEKEGGETKKTRKGRRVFSQHPKREPTKRNLSHFKGNTNLLINQDAQS